MTIRALTLFSRTARAVAVLFLTVALIGAACSLPGSPIPLLCTLPLFAVVGVPSDILFDHRLLAQSLLMLSLVPVIALACLIVSLLLYSSALSGTIPDVLPQALALALLTLGALALPLTLVTADARSRRERQAGDNSRVIP